MSRNIRPGKPTILAAAGCLCILLCVYRVQAAIPLSDVPLFLSSGVDPNVFFEVDDSGSMDWEILTRQYWHYCEYDRDAPTDVYDFASDVCWSNPFTDGLWSSWTGSSTRTFEYIYPNGDNSYSNNCNSSRETLLSCNSDLNSNSPYLKDWRILSSDFNVLYYNPQQVYRPWSGPCLTDGTGCNNASFSATRSDPREGKAGYSIIRNLDNFTYEVWGDDRGYTGSRPYRGNEINATATANGEIDLWDKHRRFTFNGSSITVETVTYTPDSSGLNPAITTSTLTGSGCFTELANNESSCQTITQAKKNVANWYQYARKRSFVTKGAIAAVIIENPGFRYGLDMINGSSNFVEVPAGFGNYSSHNADLLTELFDVAWPAYGTPLRQGLERAGKYFDDQLGLGDPIDYSCQKNFSILFTDGYWNGNNPLVNDVDGDGISATVADVARHYYETDLSALPDEVPTDSFDNASYQHMVTFSVAFGVEGNLTDTDGDGWPDPALTESSSWGDPFSNTPARIDDLWHAAYNSRGTYVSAQTPTAVVDGLRASLQNIQDRVASASSVALSTGFISSETNLYQARFNSADWHGQLLSIPVLNDGSLGSSTLDAGQLLPAYNDRVIYTYNGTDGVPFHWGDLNASQQAILNKNGSGVTDSMGEDRLNYLRGDTSNEQPTGPFRLRTSSRLGDIVNSAPMYVAVPPFRYPDIWGTGAPENCTGCQYSSFKAGNLDRTPMVYAGSNDGMLHGFDADTLVEQMAYVPGIVFDNLSLLSDPDYSHRFYVDGTPTVVDTFFEIDNSWHTVIVGGLNKGGQGIFALDVTDPSAFTDVSSAADDTVLWEFSDADDIDMGYSYSRPAVVRMHNGDWAAVFGNGYNNSSSDGDTSTTGHAVLYIVDIEDGSLIRKIDTGAGSPGNPNGLATPAAVDVDGDHIVDTIYAGDLQGNLWKFDVSSSNKNQWESAFKTGSNPQPFFMARDSVGNPQPITVRPDVGRGLNGLDIMLYFGTGKYLGSTDVTDTSQQTFYGIIDKGLNDTTRNQLVEQTVDFQSASYRVTSSNQPGTTDMGWYMDLPDNGERVVANPVLRSGRIIFVTITPQSDPCTAGGSSWLMELHARTGSRLGAPPFDINSDGVFNLEDMIDTDGDGDPDTPPSGKRIPELIPAPAILPDETAEYKYTPDSNGNLSVTVENPGKNNVGRQSWRQLR